MSGVPQDIDRGPGKVGAKYRVGMGAQNLISLNLNLKKNISMYYHLLLDASSELMNTVL